MIDAITIVLDNKYIPGYKAMISSIISHTENFDIPVICWNIDLTKENVSYCKSIYGNIEFRDTDKSKYAVRPNSIPHLKDSFYKFETFRLAKEFNHTLFIDCDIVFLTSIQELLNTKISNKLGICFHGSPWNQYNTGLYIINKDDNLSLYNTCIKKMTSVKNSPLGDQSMIDEDIRKGKLKVDKIPHKWNTTKRQIKDQKQQNYNSIHFVSKKPWEGDGDKAYKELEEIWWNYYKK